MLKKLWEQIKTLFCVWSEEQMVRHLNSSGRWDCKKK